MNNSILSLDLNVPRVLSGLVSAESLLQRVGAATGKERDENAVVAGG